MMTPNWGWGQTVNIAAGETKTEDFTIGSDATATLPDGWKVDKNTTVRKVGTYSDAVTATERSGGNDMATNAGNGIYNFGAGEAASATDRAVGGLSSGSASKSVNIYVQLTNTGASTINDLTISYAVEKYRQGSNSAGFSFQMYYSTDGITFISAGSDFLTSFAADTDNTGYTSAPGSIVNVESKTLGQIIEAGNSLYLAWNYSVTSGSTTANAQALGIDDVSITANGGAASPLISITPSSLSDFEYTQGSGPSAEQTFTISGSNLTANISIVPPANYEISTGTGNSFSPTNPVILTHTDGIATSTTVYVRLKAGLAIADYDEEITASSTDATDKTVSCSGSVTAPPPPDAPVATAATAITETGFTANWNTVAGATGYFLDVYNSGEGAIATDLIISEYIEGSGNNKAIEIFNGTGLSVDLSNYTLKKQVNGAGTFGSDLILSGILANNDVYVIANSSSNAAILSVADLSTTSGIVTFNGNDAVALYKSGSQIDVVGVVDQAADWGKDVTLVRKSSVTSPTISYSISDWDSYATDEFSYLGSHTMGAGATYDLNNESVGNVTSYAVTGLSTGTTYKYVVRAANTNGTSVNSNEIEVTTTGNVAPEITNIVQTPASGINTSTTVSVSADVTDSDGTVAGVKLHWGTVSGSLGNTIDMSLAGGSTYTTDTDIPAQTVGTVVYYEVYALDDDVAETTSPEQSYTVYYGEPTSHAAGFSAEVSSPTSSSVKVIWEDATGGTEPEGYVVKASGTGYGDITAPTNGNEETAAEFVKIVAQGVKEASFTGLDAEKTYYFKIWPFTNSGAAILYKTDGTVPEASATTTAAPPSGLQIGTAATAYTIDFDNTLEEVNNGQFDGTGFTTEPAVGQLNSNAWSVTGMSDGALEFGGSATTGDFARGASSGGVTNGGVYAFEVESNNYALGFQPTGTDWAPGTVILKAQNQTSSIISSIEIIYTVYIYNDQGRSSSFNFGHSIDNETYTDIPELDLVSETTADGSPAWKAYKRVERITGLNLADKAYYYFRWSSADVGGGGSRDEFALDDIKIVANPTDSYALTGTFEEVVLGSNAEVVIEKDASVTVNATLTNNAGATGLAIASAATGTGSLIHNADNVSATIQRYVTGGQIPDSDPARYKYHLLSIPLDANILAGDVFTGTYLWHFVPNKPDIDSWTGISNLTEDLDYRKGFLSYVETADNTFSFTGNMNNGSFSTAAETIPVGKFKLIPNPYPSAIDWDLVVKTDIEQAVYFYNSETGNYVSYLDATIPGGQKYIPVGQAVFVEAKTANPTITFDNGVRAHSNQTFYKNANQAYKDVLKIAVTANNSADATFIRFREMADNSYNGFDDASKLRGFAGSPQLYTQSADDKALSINTLATSQETVIVPLAYELEVAGEAVLSFEYLETFEPTVTIFLEDLLLDKMIDLREQSTYSFEHAVENDPLRFKIHFMGVTNVNEMASLAENLNIWTSDKQLYILANTAVDGDLQIDLFDLSGRLLKTVSQPVQTPNRISLPDYEGVIMVRVRNNSFVQTQKVFIR